MTKAKTTKRALLLSVLSMMLCMAMLVGSTFAWFTDSVTSGKNKIVAGNLDVELEYSVDGKTWTTVDENTNMFKEDALWEPGYTEVVYLQVKNAGSLALKYRLGINEAGKVLGETANGDPIDLANYIKFGVVAAEDAFADRDAAREAVKDTAGLISAGYSSGEGHLTAGKTSEMLALVVYMPEDVGNEANHGTDKKAPEIYMGINLVATQDTVETDSFDNQYDKNAEWPEIEVTEDNKAWYAAEQSNYTIKNGNELAYLATLVNDGTENFKGKTISLANDIELPVGGWVAIGTYENPFKGTFNGNGHTVSNIVINDNNGNEPTGFFGAANGAVIENLKVSGTMTLAAVQSHESVGGAYAEFFGNGGICGYANKSTIKKCTNDIDIDATARNAAGEAGLSIGGIVGCGVSTTIENCLNEGDIKVSESVPTMAGGITSLAGGMNSMTYATVKNCVNAGSNNGTNGAATEESLDFSGSIVALGIKGSIVNCYSVNGQNVIGMDAEVGTPVTEGYVDNATSLSDFANLDGQVWEFGSNGYPVIK